MQIETADSLGFLPIIYSPLLCERNNLQFLEVRRNYCHLWVKKAGMTSHVYLSFPQVLELTLRWASDLSALAQTVSETSLALSN